VFEKKNLKALLCTQKPKIAPHEKLEIDAFLEMRSEADARQDCRLSEI
jgi:hypothetical protein